MNYIFGEKIENHYEPYSHYHALFEKFIEVIEDEDNMRENNDEVKEAKPVLKALVGAHNQKIKARHYNFKNDTFIDHEFTELQRLCFLFHLGMDAWHFNLMSSLEYQALCHKVLEDEYGQERVKDLKKVIYLFSVWAWG